jgi:glyoxylase I family protein
VRPVDHLDLVVSDLERSLAFYNGLLEPLGFTQNVEVEGERGERVVYIGGSGGASVSLRQAQTKPDGPYDRYSIGLHHLCFGASSREVVEERAQWLRGQGAEIESEPQEYTYMPGYYAVFFYDPDGIKLEIKYTPAD